MENTCTLSGSAELKELKISQFVLGGVDGFGLVSCGSNVNHVDEILDELVVLSSNGAVDFQSAKHPFD